MSPFLGDILLLKVKQLCQITVREYTSILCHEKGCECICRMPNTERERERAYLSSIVLFLKGSVFWGTGSRAVQTMAANSISQWRRQWRWSEMLCWTHMALHSPHSSPCWSGTLFQVYKKKPSNYNQYLLVVIILYPSASVQYELKLIGVTHIYSSNHHCNCIIVGTLGTQQEYTLNGTPQHQNPNYGPPEIGHAIQIPSTYSVLPGS